MYLPSRDNWTEWKDSESEIQTSEGLPRYEGGIMPESVVIAPQNETYWFDTENRVLFAFFLRYHRYGSYYREGSSWKINNTVATAYYPGEVPYWDYIYHRPPYYENYPYTLNAPRQNWELVRMGTPLYNKFYHPNEISDVYTNFEDSKILHGQTEHLVTHNSGISFGVSYTKYYHFITTQFWDLFYTEVPFQFAFPAPLIPLGILGAGVLLASAGSIVNAASIAHRRRRQGE